MPAVESRESDPQAWMAIARKDLRRARLLFAAKPADLAGGLFHVQQAAEKAMKAFLAANDVPIVHTHNLRVVAEACVALDEGLRGSLVGVEALSDYASRFRYPNTSPEPEVAEAEAALALAERVVNAVAARLGVGG